MFSINTVRGNGTFGGFEPIRFASAFGVPALGIGGWPHIVLLRGWALALAVAGWLNNRSSAALVSFYNSMSNGLVERMVGHRTRLA